MRVLAVLIVAAILLIPYVPVDADSDDVIGISSIDELMGIGTSLPSDGDYILLNDLVLHSDRTLDVGIAMEDDDIVFTVTTEGYLPSSMVDRLTVTLNRERAVSDTYPVVGFPCSAVMGTNVLSVELDGWRSMTVLEADAFVDGNVIGMVAESNISTITVPFTGTLDGLGHRISGIGSFGESCSLFSSSHGASFRNLTLEGTFASMVSEDVSSYGNLSTDIGCTASSLVSVATDTVFERITVISEVVSLTRSEYTLGQGGVDGLSFSTQCGRQSVSGGIVAESTDCDFIACSVSGRVTSFVGSELSMEVLADPSGVDTSSDTAYNESLTVVGGITGISDNDRFAFCNTGADIVTVCDDSVSSDREITGFDMGNRVQSASYIGCIAGKMTGSYVYGCSDHGDPNDTYRVVLHIPGTSVHDSYTGSMCGSSVGCTFDTCSVSDEISSLSESDTVRDSSNDTVIPDCSFAVTLDNGSDIVFEGLEDEYRMMDGRCPILGFIGDEKGLGMTCTDGGAALVQGRLVLNPTFDWSENTYKDMRVEIREHDDGMSADLVILVVTCTIAVTLVVLTVRSLGRM